MPAKTLAAAASSGKSTDISFDANDLLLGFSFSVWPDGSPGRCNEQLAKSLRADLLHVRGNDRPIVGLQWEVFDALEDLNTEKLRAIQFVPDRMVAGPSVFEETDILDAPALLALLADDRFAATRRLNACVTSELDGHNGRNAPELRAALNRLVDNSRLFDLFDGFVELVDADRSGGRPEFHFLGTEKRRLPTKGLYPRGLRRFQARRINRLLIETIVPASLLRRGEELDVPRVLDHLIDAVDVRRLRSVWVYAHPAHREFCRMKTIEALLERGWSGAHDKVKWGGTVGWDPARTWDADSAQVWCRSLENWESYVASGFSRM